MIDSNNHDRRASASALHRCSNQQVMSMEAMHIHAAQQLMARQRVSSAAQQQYQQQQHGAPSCYPSASSLVPNEGLYSMTMPPIHSSSNNMQLTGMAYRMPPSSLLNEQRTNVVPPEARTLHQTALHHLLQRKASMVLSSEMKPQVQASQPTLMKAIIVQQQQKPAPTSFWEKKKEERRQTYQYRDFAKDNNHSTTEALAAAQQQRCNYDQTFPVILYRLLSNPDFKDYISWLPHGRAFRIKKPDDVEDKVLHRYFRGTKITSFMRQINGWGFRRMPTGPDRNSYYHEMFLRGLPHLCGQIRRPTTHKVKSSSDPNTHPNFYDQKTLVALPDTEDAVDGSDSNQGPTGSIRSRQDNQAQSALHPEGGMPLTSSNLHKTSNDVDCSDPDASRLILGGKRRGSVVSECSESVGSNNNPDAIGSSSGCHSDTGSSSCDGEERSVNTASPTNVVYISDGPDTACSCGRSAVSVPSSGPEAGTTASGGSSSTPRKSSVTLQPSGNPASNGHSSSADAGSLLHLLTETASRATPLVASPPPVAFVVTDSGVNNNDYDPRDCGSDTITAPEQLRRPVSRWAASSRGPLRKRAYRQVDVLHVRRDVKRKTNSPVISQGESSDGSTSSSD